VTPRWGHWLAAIALLAAPALAAAQAEPAAELVTVRQGSALLVIARNRYEGPVEVELSGSANGDRALPLREIVPAGASLPLLHLPADAAAPELHLIAVPGEPHVEARDVMYSLPVEESNYELGQGFHGGFSHDDAANRYAVDLIVPEGTAVLAARAGVVMQASSGFSDGGVDPGLARRANQIRILHDDGSMALYAHLQENGVVVRRGQRVTLGQVIGYTGNTGYTSGPHLHFTVQVNGGLELLSVPFRMIGPHGQLPLRN
jgi:murein DD-endopeptidase MepM/ murein hydrolase activator NlpD